VRFSLSLYWIRQLIQISRISSYSTRKLSDINLLHIDNNFIRWQRSLGIEISKLFFLIQLRYIHWLGFFSGIGQMYLLLVLTYLFARCTFGYMLVNEWVSSWLLRTGVADVNSFFTTLNTLVVKLLLVLRLRAIWNKDLIGERARNMGQWTYLFFGFQWH